MAKRERARMDMGRGYGYVTGKANYAYEQDGKYFDHRGVEVFPDELDTGPRQAAPPAAKEPEPEEAIPAAPPEPDPEPEAAAPEAAPAEAVDTSGWTMAQLRARYTELAGKKAKVGLTKVAITDLIADAEGVGGPVDVF